MTQKALKLALEALGAYMSATDIEEDAKAHDLMAEAFFKIKEALAQPEQEPDWYHGVDKHGCNRFYHKTEARTSEFNTPLYTTPPKPTAQNFCSRCGKRTPDLTTIHTCTPPRGLEMT